MSEVKEIKDKLAAFERMVKGEYGEDIMFRANLGAINRMLIKRGRGEELLEAMKDMVRGYKEKCEKAEETETAKSKKEKAKV